MVGPGTARDRRTGALACTARAARARFSRPGPGGKVKGGRPTQKRRPTEKRVPARHREGGPAKGAVRLESRSASQAARAASDEHAHPVGPARPPSTTLLQLLQLSPLPSLLVVRAPGIQRLRARPADEGALRAPLIAWSPIETGRHRFHHW